MKSTGVYVNGHRFGNIHCSLYYPFKGQYCILLLYCNKGLVRVECIASSHFKQTLRRIKLKLAINCINCVSRHTDA